MKHLYIIGNGFDIFTGLKTRYVDFQYWLQNNYPFIYENIVAAYDIKGEWWNDFEVQLGRLNVKQYVKKFLPPDKPIEEILKESAERRAFEEKYNLPPSMRGSHCARRLRGLLDVLQYCFEKWVSHCQEIFFDAKYVKLEKDDSYFINFNYTDVLQWLYHIPEENVLHIHGRASTKERLIFGHNYHLSGGGSKDEDETSFELYKYEKNPYQYILKYDELPNILKDVEFVHIYGFSFSPVDIDYIDWIYINTPNDSQWEVSWFSEQDKDRVDSFVLEHWGLKTRLRLIRLDDIKVERN
jgi:hypothetical protein